MAAPAALSDFKVYKDVLHIRLARNQAVRCESDAAVTLSPNVEVTGEMTGSILGALGRQMLSGESFFMQVIRCREGSHGEAVVAPKYTGDISVIDDIQGVPVRMRPGVFLAAAETVDVKTVTQGVVGGFFSGNGLFILEASGRGALAFAAFGSIFTRELAAGQECMVDNGHVVAWDATMTYTMEMANKRSMMSSFTSGEGLMCKFRGPGTVWVQSRNTDAFRQWLFEGQKRGGGGGSFAGPAGMAFLMCFMCLFFLAFFGILALAFTQGATVDSGDMRY